MLGRSLTYVDLPRDIGLAQPGLVLGEHTEWCIDGQATLVQHPQAAVPAVGWLLGGPAMRWEEWPAGPPACSGDGSGWSLHDV
ncbi:hypothetical protein BXY51_009215 [Actinoplanes cyaneus]|nr:hypothetical protein [Actinoplanes cyaneus]